MAEEVRAEMVGNVMKVVAAPGDALDLARPARGDVARLYPVVHDRPIELEGARDLGLAAEHFDQSRRAIHGPDSRPSKWL